MRSKRELTSSSGGDHSFFTLTNPNEKIEDQTLITYIDKDYTLKAKNSGWLNSSKIAKGTDFDDEDEDDNDETNDKLIDYFNNLYEEDERKVVGGQVGLDNLGNTCYMNAALQALSNCYALTGFFLECAPYIQTRVLLQTNSMDPSSLNKFSCLSLSYLKLMKELWQQTNRRQNSIGSYCPTELVQAIKYVNPMFRGYMQHDSQEFLIYLMDQLHEELKRPIYPNEDDEEENEQTDTSRADSDKDEDDTVVSHTSPANDVDSKISRLKIAQGIASRLT